MEKGYEMEEGVGTANGMVEKSRGLRIRFCSSAFREQFFPV